MKTQWIKFFDRMIVLLLGASGMFSSCNVINDTPVEYGMPHADFELKGTVENEASQPIKNIQVVRPFGYQNAFGDTIYTNEKGQYAFVYDGMESKYQLKFEDIDGPENGGYFQTKMIEGKFTDADLAKKGDGRWYDGKFVKTQDVTLESASATMYGVRSTSFRRK